MSKTAHPNATARLTVSVFPETLTQLTRLSQLTDRSKSAVIRQLVQAESDRQNEAVLAEYGRSLSAQFEGSVSDRALQFARELDAAKLAKASQATGEIVTFITQPRGNKTEETKPSSVYQDSTGNSEPEIPCTRSN